MIELPLVEWARQKGIHYTTAKRRFDKWLILNAEYNDLWKIIVYLERSLEEEKEEIRSRIRSKVQAWVTWFTHNPKPAIATINPMQPSPEEEPKPKKTSWYVKKQKKEIIPSVAEGDDLILENIRRCQALWLNYKNIDVTLARACFWWPTNVSLYIDEYERAKTKLASHIGILEAQSEIDFANFEFKNNTPSTIKEEPKEKTTFDIAFELAEANEKDYDYLKWFLEQPNEPCLMGDEVIIEFLKQYKKGKWQDITEWATDRVIANRPKY